MRRAWGSAAIAVVGILLLSSCTVTGRTLPAELTSTSSPEPTPTGPVFFGQTTTRPSGSATLPWRRLSVSADGRRIEISSSKKACSTPEQALVAETSTTVTITVLATPRGGTCTQEGLDRVGLVVLDAPLGDRDLVHGR